MMLHRITTRVDAGHGVAVVELGPLAANRAHPHWRRQPSPADLYCFPQAEPHEERRRFDPILSAFMIFNVLLGSSCGVCRARS